MGRDREALTGRLRRGQQFPRQPRGVKCPQRFCDLRSRRTGQGPRRGQPTENHRRRGAGDNGTGHQPAAVGKVRRANGTIVRRSGRRLHIAHQLRVRRALCQTSLGEFRAEPHRLRCRDDEQGIKSGAGQSRECRAIRRRRCVVRQNFCDRIGLRKIAGAIRQLRRLRDDLLSQLLQLQVQILALERGNMMLPMPLARHRQQEQQQYHGGAGSQPHRSSRAPSANAFSQCHLLSAAEVRKANTWELDIIRSSVSTMPAVCLIPLERTDRRCTIC